MSNEPIYKVPPLIQHPQKSFFVRHILAEILGLALIIAAGAVVYYLRISESDIFANFPIHKSNRLCIQVITQAKNPSTGEIKTFPTPCDVPKGWEKVEAESIPQ